MKTICRGENVGKVLCVGEMVIDFLPGKEPGSYIQRAGGAPANVAIALSRQGQGAAFCGMLGRDAFGRYLLGVLEENGVVPCVQELTEEAVTTMTFVTLSEEGERSFTFAQKKGADAMLRKDQISSKQIEGADIVHAGSCSLSGGSAAEATAYAMQKGREYGKLISFDVNYRELRWRSRQEAAQAVRGVLPYVDFLKVSDEEIGIFGDGEQIFRLQEEYGIALIVETLGAKGAHCLWNGQLLAKEGIQTECVDSCGAGDAFWGGFLAALLEQGVKKTADLSEPLLLHAMEQGMIAGSLCVEKKGAIESLPVLEQIRGRGKEVYGWES